jgi:AcrR family transcriptional regulator
MTNKPQAIRADARRNYDRLIQAAQALFSTQGPSATLEGIAKRADVGIGTLYRHFPTRKLLLEAVFADTVSGLVEKVSSLLKTASPDKALTSWLRLTAECSEKYNGFSDFLALTLNDKDSPIVIAGSRLLTEAQDSGLLRKDITIVDLLQLINGIVVGTTEEDLKRTDRLFSIMIAGLHSVDVQ